MTPGEELAQLAASQKPVKLRGSGLAFLCVSVVGLFFSLLAVGLRIWSRAWLSRRAKLWGWDDTLSVLSLVAYIVACAYAILGALYGLGGPEIRSERALALSVRAIEYNNWWEISYLFSIGLSKTSIGIAILRIALQRRHRYSVWALLIGCNMAYAAGVIYLVSSCQPFAARWNPLVGSCPGDVAMMPLAYCLVTFAAVTDAGYAIIPIDILRGLRNMPSRLRYTLMAVMGMSSLAAISSLARYPFIQYFPPKYGNLSNNAWVPLLSMVECTVALVFGCLPAIGHRLHIFGKPNTQPKRSKESSNQGPSWMAEKTIGGTPFTRGTTPGEGLCLTPPGRGGNETRVWSESAQDNGKMF